MTIGTVQGVAQLAHELLAASETALATTIGGTPEITYLSPGLPALDRGCDTLAVWAALVTDEQTAPLTPLPQVGQRRRVAWLNIVTLNALVARCVRVGYSTQRGYSYPTSEQLTEDAEKVMEDGWALWNGISLAVRDDGLFGGVCQDIKLPTLSALTPQGAMAGWVLTVQVELPGYAGGS